MKSNELELVSVLMSTYKEPIEWVKKSVDSILNQTYGNIEFIVLVDDPLNYEIIDVLNEYQKTRTFMKVIINEHNLGLVASLNKGLKYCSGSYIARMDADDISHKERIEKELEYLKTNSYDIVGCRFVPFSGEKTYKSRLVPQFAYISNKLLRITNCVGHPTWLVKREVYEILGGYRDIDGCEDYDFLLRASLNGFEIGSVNEELLQYRHNQFSISSKSCIMQQTTSDLLRRYYRHKKVLPISIYREWMNSEKYKSEYQLNDNYQNLKNQVKGEKKRKTIMLVVARLVVNKKFYTNVYNMGCWRFWMRINKIMNIVHKGKCF